MVQQHLLGGDGSRDQELLENSTHTSQEFLKQVPIADLRSRSPSPDCIAEPRPASRGRASSLCVFGRAAKLRGRRRALLLLLFDINDIDDNNYDRCLTAGDGFMGAMPTLAMSAGPACEPTFSLGSKHQGMNRLLRLLSSCVLIILVG